MSVLKTLVAVKNIKGTSFVGVRAYENSKGEISNQTFLVGVNYANLLANDLKTLQSENIKKYVKSLKKIEDATIVDKAYNELVSSLEKRTASEEEKEKLRIANDSTMNRSDAQSEAYVSIAKGLRAKDDALYIYGLVVRKTVLKKGEYKTTNKQAKTKIKEAIKTFAELRELNYRNFKLGSLETLKIQGVTI